MSRKLSASFARVSQTCHGSKMKSLRRTGICMDLRASRRFFSVPRKNSPSVRTESAAAPADSREVARATGSNGSRRTPREGDAGFSSAKTLGPGRVSAAEKSRRGVAAATPYLSAVSGKTCLRCSTSARRASRMRSRTVPVGTGVCMSVSYHAKEWRNESQTRRKSSVVSRQFSERKNLGQDDGQIQRRVREIAGGDCERGGRDCAEIFSDSGSAD